jgi:guanylate kinase
MKGNLIIISSPSGGGKGTLIREVLTSLPDITYSISYTTRPIREGEEDGREYFFVSKDDFEHRRDEGEFLEHAVVHGNYYGTSQVQVERVMESGRDVLLEIDVQGAAILYEKMPDAVSIFILPPSFPVLRSRLTLRATESSGDLNLRLKNSFAEVREYGKFRYVVVNEDLNAAVNDLRTIIRAERLRTDRQKDVISGILDGFDASKYQISGE